MATDTEIDRLLILFVVIGLEGAYAYARNRHFSPFEHIGMQQTHTKAFNSAIFVLFRDGLTCAFRV